MLRSLPKRCGSVSFVLFALCHEILCRLRLRALQPGTACALGACSLRTDESPALVGRLRQRGTTGRRLVATAACLAVAVFWPQFAAAQSVTCPPNPPSFLDLSKTSPASSTDSSPDAKFQERTAAFIQYGACQNLPGTDSCKGVPDLGEGFQVWLFSRLGSSDTTKQQEAINYLRNISSSNIPAMGTDQCDDSLMSSLEGFLAPGSTRIGDGDSWLIGLVAALYRYPNVLPSDVQDHILSLIPAKPGLGSVESLSFGLNPALAAGICGLACADTTIGFPICFAGCEAFFAEEKVSIPETENHLNMIYVLQYLANQIRFQKTNDPNFDNSQNGYRAALLNRLRDFVRNDFIEYNAHNYEDFDMFALLTVYSYASDPTVKQAANNVLDYLSAKVTVTSNNARRSVPFRRRNEAGHTCGELIQQDCYDPQTGFYMMLAGNTEILGNLPDFAGGCPAPGSDPGQGYSTGVVPAVELTASAGSGFTISIDSVDSSGAIASSSIASGGHGYSVGDEGVFPPGTGNGSVFWHVDSVSQNDPNQLNGTVLSFHLLTKCLPANNLPGSYAVEFGWAAINHYTIDPTILDLFINSADRKFYQFFHYERNLDLDGFHDSNDELYYGSPSYLISAGGHTTHYAYTADAPFPLSLVPFDRGKSADQGFAPPTTLMPSGALHSRDQMIQFDASLCVAPNFACGLNLRIPYTYTTMPDPNPKAGAAGTWQFIDKHSDLGKPGYYVAIYQQGNFGFFDVYDTWKNDNGVTDINDFIGRVHANNDAQTYAATGTNTYKTVAGDVIQFTLDPHIVSINGHQPYDPTRTNGDVINNDGQGTITITNPVLGKSLTLDATQPVHAYICLDGKMFF